MTGKTTSADDLADIILALATPQKRLIVAVAGPPGSGKSTLAETVVENLNGARPGVAAILPMDGYHYDDLLLVPRGLRSRKGAPETFDVAGFGHMLARLKANEEPEIAVPVFDRSIEISRAGARMIDQSVSIVIVEGNYLLLDESRWRDLHSRYDLTVMIREPEEVLRDRLEQRWHALSPEALAMQIDGNDLPNARYVMNASIEPDYLISVS
jgi:pantothenate kinase